MWHLSTGSICLCWRSRFSLPFCSQEFHAVPQSHGTLVILGVLTIRRGQIWANDIALLGRHRPSAPGKARVWFNLGGAYLQANPDKARSALTRALELDPDFVEALYDMGVIEQGKRNWNAAPRQLWAAVQQRRSYWPAWNNMANTLFALGQQDRALDIFETNFRLESRIIGQRNITPPSCISCGADIRMLFRS